MKHIFPLLILLFMGLNACSSTKKSTGINDPNKPPAISADSDSAKSIEIMPLFRGEDATAFRNWVTSQLVYPPTMLEQGVEGRVVINFVVGIDGKIDAWDVASSPHRLLSEEVVRIIKKSPTWTPGYKNGEPVRVLFTFPVDFRLTGSDMFSTPQNNNPYYRSPLEIRENRRY